MTPSSPARTSSRGGVALWAGAAAYALAPAGAAAGGLALAPILALAGLASARPSWLMRAARQGPLVAGIVVAFLVWASLSAFWSQEAGWGQAGRLVATGAAALAFAVAAGATPDMRRLTQAAGLAAITVLILLLGVEAMGDMPLNRAAQPADTPTWMIERNPGRGVSLLVVAFWGVAAALAICGRRLAAAAIIAAALGLSLCFTQGANFLALAAGIAAAAAAFAWPRLALIGLCTLVSAWMLAAPAVLPLLFADQALVDRLPETWGIRVEIWKYVSAEIAARPWFGWGLDAARGMDELIPFRGQMIDAVPLHPHSASLQIWLETGAVGAGLIAGAVLAGGMALARALRSHRWVAAAAAGAIAAYAVLANVSYGAWQEWWIAAAGFAAALVAATGNMTEKS